MTTVIKDPWKTIGTLALWMHQTRCEKCKESNGPLESCPDYNYWTTYATQRMERRQSAIVGKFVSGKPTEITRLERRMKMGEKAKDLKDCLDGYIKGLIDNNLTLDQVNELYSRMMDLATINRRYKGSVCLKKDKKKKKRTS